MSVAIETLEKEIQSNVEQLVVLQEANKLIKSLKFERDHLKYQLEYLRIMEEDFSDDCMERAIVYADEKWRKGNG